MIEPGGRRNELSRPRGLRIGQAIQHLVAARQLLGQARRELHPLDEMRDPVQLISRVEDQLQQLAEGLIP